MDIKDLFKESYIGKQVTISGWVRNHRKSSNFAFIVLSDGTTINTLQVVYDTSLSNYEEINKVLVGSSLEVAGTIVESSGNQDFELKAESIKILGLADETYPIQAKRHTREFLREVGHLRARTNLFNAVFRVRSVAAMAIHKYFQDRNYVYFHAPIITSSDCEGAGEMFQVTTLDLNRIASSGKYEPEKDFYGKTTGLTVSGQLEAETFATAFKKTYTFGPTFRAENSNTKVHASEFWMIEPEISFCDLEGDMDIMEDMLKYVVSYVLENAEDEMKFLDQFVEKGLIDKLTRLVNSKFTRIDHKDVITILKNADVKWEFEPEYGEDIAKEIKAFYMKQNEDGETVAAVDLEVPGAGELMGGSQREESYEKLVKRMDELGMNKEELSWYLDLRKYGTCIHSGFGMGFERLLIYITGIDNIRDVIPYPRTPGNCEF